jgi:hypothetical protein
VSSAFPKFEPLHCKPDEHKAKKSFSFGIPFSFWTFAKRKGNKDFQDSFCKKPPLVKALPLAREFLHLTKLVRPAGTFCWMRNNKYFIYT